mmetsp:Transcript_57657/g.114454  ORF Transcript_57657/g.114454 Transcript_57657/m.114454 type:complete len:274 (+) Transcript_57657:180-1001(+)
MRTLCSTRLPDPTWRAAPICDATYAHVHPLRPTYGDLLHVGHVAAELLAHHLDRVRSDLLVDRVERTVIHTVAALVVLGADDVRVHVLHEVGEERAACLVVEVATVLSRVRDHRVHLKELHARDGVRDEGRLVQRLVVSGLWLHADLDHFFEGQLDASLDHRHHQHRVVEVLLLGDVHATSRRLLERCLARLCPPLEQVDVVVIPVGHHCRREVARDDIILVFRVERLHDDLKLLSELEGLDLRRVVQAVHHAGDTTMLEGLGDRLPAKLDEL